MPEDSSIFDEVHAALKALSDFLEDEVAFSAIEGMLVRLAKRYPQVGVIVRKLSGLVDDLKAELEEYNVAGALAAAPKFLEAVGKVLTSSEKMVDPEHMDELKAAEVAVEQVEEVIPVLSATLVLIDNIKTKIDGLKAKLPPATP